MSKIALSEIPRVGPVKEDIFYLRGFMSDMKTPALKNIVNTAEIIVTSNREDLIKKINYILRLKGQDEINLDIFEPSDISMTNPYGNLLDNNKFKYPKIKLVAEIFYNIVEMNDNRKRRNDDFVLDEMAVADIFKIKNMNDAILFADEYGTEYPLFDQYGYQVHLLNIVEISSYVINDSNKLVSIARRLLRRRLDGDLPENVFFDNLDHSAPFDSLYDYKVEYTYKILSKVPVFEFSQIKDRCAPRWIPLWQLIHINRYKYRIPESTIYMIRNISKFKRLDRDMKEEMEEKFRYLFTNCIISYFDYELYWEKNLRIPLEKVFCDHMEINYYSKNILPVNVSIDNIVNDIYYESISCDRVSLPYLLENDIMFIGNSAYHESFKRLTTRKNKKAILFYYSRIIMFGEFEKWLRMLEAMCLSLKVLNEKDPSKIDKKYIGAIVNHELKENRKTRDKSKLTVKRFKIENCFNLKANNEDPDNSNHKNYPIILDFSSQNRVSVSDIVLQPTTQLLDLSNNLLVELSDYCFLENTDYSDKCLTELKLKKNMIQFIGLNPFQFADKLMVLDLSYNQITDIGKHMFFGLVHLVNLNLSFNRISKIDPDTFDFLIKLKYLNLSNNLIYNLHQLHFRKTIELGCLDLSFNQIESLKTGIFDRLVNMTNLYLNNNFISELDADGVFYLNDGNQLKVLNLSNNKIFSIKDNYFVKVPNLEILCLNNNLLAYVKSRTFRGLKKLKALFLNDNKLTYIEGGRSSFTGLDSLEILFVFNNEIASSRSVLNDEYFTHQRNPRFMIKFDGEMLSRNMKRNPFYKYAVEMIYDRNFFLKLKIDSRPNNRN